MTSTPLPAMASLPGGSPLSLAHSASFRRRPVPISFPSSASPDSRSDKSDYSPPQSTRSAAATSQFDPRNSRASARSSSGQSLNSNKPLPALRTSPSTPPLFMANRQSTSTISSMKALPRAPPELDTDHIRSLQAQLDGLTVRRNNLNRLLRDVIEPVSENPLVSDLRARRHVKARQRALEEELAELAVEAHDIGIRLHRAWKRKEEKDGAGDMSAIWVKRVTS